jgi:hypothetical protein
MICEPVRDRLPHIVRARTAEAAVARTLVVRTADLSVFSLLLAQNARVCFLKS